MTNEAFDVAAAREFAEEFLSDGVRFGDDVATRLLRACDEIERMRAPLAVAFELARKSVGCGDNSCAFEKPAGMATNGGCRCIERGAGPGVPAALGQLYRAVKTAVAAKAPGAS